MSETDSGDGQESYSVEIEREREWGEPQKPPPPPRSGNTDLQFWGYRDKGARSCFVRLATFLGGRRRMVSILYGAHPPTHTHTHTRARAGLEIGSPHPLDIVVILVPEREGLLNLQAQDPVLVHPAVPPLRRGLGPLGLLRYALVGKKERRGGGGPGFLFL
ncbi:hypothetical protein LX36DRAFT_312905 [Colletotrichum falcatum]|nr:hypothetical protein LX36DRAFT_312905 [Colletotrichum falcatum]